MLTGLTGLGLFSFLSWKYYNENKDKNIQNKIAVTILSFRSTYPELIYFRKYYQEKIKCISFDFIGTIARYTGLTYRDILEIIEKRYDLRGYADWRLKIEKDINVQSSEDFIIQMTIKFSKTPEEVNKILKHEEEIENLCLIPFVKNTRKYQKLEEDVILIVVDTIRESKFIEKFVMDNNIFKNKEIHVYTSFSGKRDKWIWKVLKEYYSFDSHYGESLIIE